MVAGWRSVPMAVLGRVCQHRLLLPRRPAAHSHVWLQAEAHCNSKRGRSYMLLSLSADNFRKFSVNTVQLLYPRLMTPVENDADTGA